MKFIGRKAELTRLTEISEFAKTSGYLTMITGRKRVGKTTLIKHFLQKNTIQSCYFFVSRKQAKTILDEFAILLTEYFPEMNQLFNIYSGSERQSNLKLQLLFNGIPFYYFIMEKEHLFGKDIIEIIHRLVLRNDGLLFNEGKDLTIEEFGKNYGRYFSILEAIASGHTQWNDISTQTGILPNRIGKYLDELLNYYDLIERKSSVFSKEIGKNSRYYLK